MVALIPDEATPGDFLEDLEAAVVGVVRLFFWDDDDDRDPFLRLLPLEGSPPVVAVDPRTAAAAASRWSCCWASNSF